MTKWFSIFKAIWKHFKWSTIFKSIWKSNIFVKLKIFISIWKTNIIRWFVDTIMHFFKKHLDAIINCEIFRSKFLFFIDIELRRFHWRFDHFWIRFAINSWSIRSWCKFSSNRVFHQILSSLSILWKILESINFTLKNNIEFNFNIIVNTFYIEVKFEVNKSILHLMNEATRFQTNKWLKNITTQHIWNQLRFCWIDIYFESFDLITSNANKQYIVRQFKQYAINMKIKINIVFIKTHHSINMIERYHESFSSHIYNHRYENFWNRLEFDFINVIQNIQ